MSLADTELVPYGYQVGGHSKTDGLPASLIDRQGRFLKKLQAGERGDREVAFYAAVEQARPAAAAAAAEGGHTSTVMPELSAWIPRSYGTRHVCGAEYLVLEDMTAAYKQPCILDIKLGFRTWYPWASESLQQKYRSKDGSTTQASLGFRVCGVLVHNSVTGSVWRVDRHWGKDLTPDTVEQAFTRFAENGHIKMADLFVGPGMLLQQLEALAEVASKQDQWHLFSSSLLIVYEGAAVTAQDIKLTVRLIDFAHTFPTVARGSGTTACATGVDENFLGGLESLIKALRHTLAKHDGLQ